MISHSCHDCEHAQFTYTKHTPPQINHRESGRCHVKVAHLIETLLPATLLREDEWKSLKGSLDRPKWIDTKQPFTDCMWWRKRQ